jgi:protein TonB
MRLRTAASCIAIALVAGACSESATGPTGTSPSVVPDGVMLGLGKHQQFQAPLFDVFRTDVLWTLSGGVDGGYISRSGMYYAPLRPPATPTIRVVATVYGSSVEATIRLSSSPADPGDCLAEGQPGDEAPMGNYVYVEELPDAIVKVTPSYPDSARQAGVDGTVMVQAHVCACGEVDETRVVKSIPLLDAAATAAVSQWIFKPALSNGEPVAVWVGVPVKFSLH